MIIQGLKSLTVCLGWGQEDAVPLIVTCSRLERSSRKVDAV